MRSFRKAPEPRKLREYRGIPGATYSSLEQDAKESLRKALAAEQGYLCAYCMARITPTESGMKIEHQEPQSVDPSRQLDYQNLLGVCLGGMGLPREEQHCDTSKADQRIWSHPAVPERNPEPHLRYLADGRLESIDPRVDHDLRVLNLNEPRRLVPNRRAALDAFAQWFIEKNRSNPGSWKRETVERFLQELRTPDASGRLQPWLGGAEFFLRKKLQRLAR